MSDDPFSGVTPIHGAENVRPLHGQTNAQRQDVLKPRAKAILDHTQFARDVEAQLDRQYLVKNWVSRGALLAVYSPPNVGKSFWALYLAYCIANGLDWAGRRVRKGRVLYIAAEGGTNFTNRIAALENPSFSFIAHPMILAGPGAQSAPLVEAIQHLERVGGEPFDFIIVDTMARVMGELDENVVPDIANLIRNLDMIRAATGAAVLLVHHTGKDVARGARGHSSLRAAVDTEIEITRDDTGIITAQVMKQRDGPTGGKFHYRLRQVELGFDQDGDPVTTCIVAPVHSEEASKPSISGQVEKVLEILSALITREDNDLCLPSAPRVRCARVDDWASACVPAGAFSSVKNNDDRRRIWHRCHDQLVDAGLIQMTSAPVGQI